MPWQGSRTWENHRSIRLLVLPACGKLARKNGRISRARQLLRTRRAYLPSVDLPGTYSLTANSPEEVIAREFILREQPDVAVAVVSAANLERSLYRSAVIQLPAGAAGGGFEDDGCGRTGGDCVGARSAASSPGRAGGTHHRECACLQEDACTRWNSVQRRPALSLPHPPEISGFICRPTQSFSRLPGTPAPYPTDWAALKLLEGDAEMIRQMTAALPAERWQAVQVIGLHDDADAGDCLGAL